MNANSNSERLERAGGAFFGRRKGHALRPHQATLMQELLPTLALDLLGPPPAKLATLFPEPVEAVRLEIGFGGGEHLASQAERHAEIGFIGCEPFINGMAKMLAQIETRKLRNVHLHFGDAAELLGWLPEASIDRIDILYPDPWPKRRHWKRRFIQNERLSALARVLRPGGELRFASDIPDYIVWTLERFLRSREFVWRAERADDWRLPWPDFVETRYEAKAKRQGRTPCYLTFSRRL
jgi:tRNA (guanine-N7-)-methyltransferase